VRWTALAIIAANVALVVALSLFVRSVHHGPPSLMRFFVFASAFALVGAMPMRLDFSEHHVSFTLTDAVVVIGFFYLGPLWLALTATAGELAPCVMKRLPPLKSVFNLSSRAAGGITAGATFVALNAGRGLGPASWFPAIAGAICWGVLNILPVAAILATAEERRYEQTLSRLIPTTAATTLLGASLGLLVAELLRDGALYAILALPVVLGVWLTNRDATHQRDEHLRVGRLYEATARTAAIHSHLDILAVVANEARSLLTGTAAICCIRDETGRWTGRTSRSTGTGGTRSSDVESILNCAGHDYGNAKSVAVPELFRGLAPDADELVVARSPQGSPAELIVAVFRSSADGRVTASGLGETLSAFAAHGAVIASNVRLLSKVEQSLASQLEANKRKDEFVATVSHELRTPLTVLLGAAQTLLRLDDRVSPGERDRLLHTAVKQGQRLQLLIEDVLLVAAAEHGNLATEMTTVIAARFAEDLLADLPDDLRLRVHLGNTPVDAAFVSDRHRLHQIVMNLVGNAGKYAPEGPIEIVISSSDDEVSIGVVDHGPGIPASDRERVFDRFIQLDQTSTRSQGGTGLGLFICRKLASQLGAALELRATDGGGCTFTVTLPRVSLRRLNDQELAENRPSPTSTDGLLRRPNELMRRPASVLAPAASQP